MTSLRVLERAKRFGMRAVWDSTTLARFAGNTYDVVFYSGAPIDEVWIRTTVEECHRRGIRCIHVASGASNSAKLVGASPLSMGALRLLRSRLVVTASSGLPAWCAPRRCEGLVHMPHSMASLHMVYPPDAFDGFSVLFAIGDHHVDEIRAIDRLRGVTGRQVARVGYGKSDVVAAQPLISIRDRPLVLLAPSWGVDNVLETVGKRLVKALLARSYRVVVRPHPVVFSERPTLIQEYQDAFSADAAFRLEAPHLSERSLAEADLLVSDYSGVAMEFAFARPRPVVSVEVPRKVRNQGYAKLGIEPLEVSIRSRLGKVVPADVDQIVAAIGLQLLSPLEPESVIQLRDRFAYNWGATGTAATDALERLLAR